MRSCKRCVLFLAVCLAAPFLASADTGGGEDESQPLPCWMPVWQQNSCSGTCTIAWCVCPGRIRCTPSTSGGAKLAPYVMASVACESWISTPTSGGPCTATTVCTGGMLAIPQNGSCGTVVVSTQTCPGVCP